MDLMNAHDKIGSQIRTQLPRHMQLRSGPVEIKMGTFEFDSGEDYAQTFTRQAFEIDPEFLKQQRCGRAAIDALVEGYHISYVDAALTGPGYIVYEYPDGTRYRAKILFLGNNRFSVTIDAMLPPAPRQ
jgi:hypothetical protein